VLKKVWVKSNEADVIYFTISESFAGNFKDIFIYLICFIYLRKMVIHLHGGSIKKLIFDKNRLLFRINRYFIRRLGGIIVLGQSHLNIFSEMVGNKRIHVVPNFVEDYLFIDKDNIRDKFGNTEPLRILFLSNLVMGKGHNELVDAYLSLNDNFKKKVTVDFAGGFESDRKKNEFLSKISKTKGIKHHGMVSGDEKKELLTRAHIFCLPTSLNEGQPISILEAYASGCVVITTDQGGIRDIFKDSINGFEVKKKSADSIKTVIEDILEKPEVLLPIAIKNRETASIRYRTSVYNASLMKIVEGIRSIT
jgi:glycosyltransferase involved in cell wall biosynthesis